VAQALARTPGPPIEAVDVGPSTSFSSSSPSPCPPLGAEAVEGRVLPVWGGERSLGYRNKVSFSAAPPTGGGGDGPAVLGLQRAGTHDGSGVIVVGGSSEDAGGGGCPLQSDAANMALRALSGALRDAGTIPAADRAAGRSGLSSVVVRSAPSPGAGPNAEPTEVLVEIVTAVAPSGDPALVVSADDVAALVDAAATRFEREAAVGRGPTGARVVGWVWTTEALEPPRARRGEGRQWHNGGGAGGQGGGRGGGRPRDGGRSRLDVGGRGRGRGHADAAASIPSPPPWQTVVVRGRAWLAESVGTVGFRVGPTTSPFWQINREGAVELRRLIAEAARGGPPLGDASSSAWDLFCGSGAWALGALPRSTGLVVGADVSAAAVAEATSAARRAGFGAAGGGGAGADGGGA